MKLLSDKIKKLFFFLFLAFIGFGSAFAQIPPQKEFPDELIEAVLQTGGTHSTVLDAKYYDGWADLMSYLRTQDVANLREIPLPFGVKFYRFAHAGNNTMTYLITPKRSGVITVTLDTKGNFKPSMDINFRENQVDLGGGKYQLKFAAKANVQYEVTVFKQPRDWGLYSIWALME